MAFSPIAIVGRACVLPGALSPEALWDVVRSGRDCVGPVPAGRWRTAPGDVLCGPDDDARNRSWSDRGGYVHGFEDIWDPSGFAVPESDLAGLDPLFHWALHCAREALANAGDDRRGIVNRHRVGAVFGNLGFPSAGLTSLAEAVWHGNKVTHPRDRFMSGGAASMLEAALGLAPGVMCLDTACASSLYAIKLACDQLHDGTVDIALAGAVNRADDLFIHVGFTALGAMSRAGQSRPFHADADGLVPAEGAGFVALKRLADARQDKDRIYGIIRGIGLSNDGRGRGFLAPSEEGQRRALQLAYEASGLTPGDVSLLECHATGTTVGDAAEIRSTGDLFGGCAGVPVGSLKSNLGHLITAAGVAGLIKVLEAIRHGERPPTIHAQSLNPELAASPFRVLTAAEPWTCTGLRVAGVSAFGFGGNNAHLLVTEDDADSAEPSTAPKSTGPTDAREVALQPLAIVGVGTVVGRAHDRPSFTRALLDGDELAGPVGEFHLGLAGLRFPPKDLEHALPQQLLLLKAAREAVGARALPQHRTGVFVGMEPDPEVCRYGLRWRLPEHLRATGADPAPQWLQTVSDDIVPTLTSAGVVGNMPNIPANRLNSQFDLGGASVSISAGEASGLRALAVAHRALSAGELDVALVGAVDLSCHPVHETALRLLENAQSRAGDAAVVLVLKRLSDAVHDADPIVAVIQPGSEAGSAPHVRGSASPPFFGAGTDDGSNGVTDGVDFSSRLGRSWAAGGLRDLVATALLLSHRVRPNGRPWLSGDPEATVGAVDRFSLRPHSAPAPALLTPRLHRFAANTPAQLLAQLDSGTPGGSGPCRLAILALDAQLETRLAAARKHIVDATPAGPGVYYRPTPVTGELAFVFTGAGSGYDGMGRTLLTALPNLGERLHNRHPAAAAALDQPWPEAVPPLQRLWSSSALCQLHAELSQDLLGLRPDAAIGYSSGESNALVATGAWTDLDALIHDANGPLFQEEIGGPMRAVQRAWGVSEVHWETWTVLAPVDEVQAVVDGVDRVYLSIIHTDTDCVIAGDAAACTRVRGILGEHRFLRLHYDLAVHVPELEQVREEWLTLHRRPVTAPLVRIYSGGLGAAYTPSETACADAILLQADRTLDFRKVVEAAWSDGVRIFVEHGPQGSCSRWTQDILGPRDAVVVALDRKGAGLLPTLEAVATLWVASVNVDVDALTTRLAIATTRGPSLRFAPRGPVSVGTPPSRSLAAPTPMQTMSPAPTLPPVLDAETYPSAVLPPAPGPQRVWAVQSLPPSTPAAPNRGPGTAAPMPTSHAAPHLPAAATADNQATRTAVATGPLLAHASTHGTALGSTHGTALASTLGTALASTHGSALASTLGTALASTHGSAVASTHGSAVGSHDTGLGSAHGTALASTHGTSVAHDGALPVTSDPVLDALREQLAALGQGERSHIELQTALHQRFLALHQQAMHLLTSGPASGPAPVVALAATTPAAAPLAPAAAAPNYDPSRVATSGLAGDRRPNAPSPTSEPVAPAVDCVQPAQVTPPIDRTSVDGGRLVQVAASRTPALPSTAGKHADPATDTAPRSPIGPTFDRAQLEVHASGRISDIFGPQFAGQDDFTRQVRMPEPPLLLADRITGLDAVPGSMGKGTIWSESDVTADKYLHQGHMPAGIMIESGQADLMLISYLGVDATNRNDRVYRLLGCELTYHTEPATHGAPAVLPKAGDTLAYDIHMDGHATQGDVRLMFFHYDCRIDGHLRLAVRKGQAGFFTDAELADSAGCLWTPADVTLDPDARVDAPTVRNTRDSFSLDDVTAFADGRPWDCFGPGYERTRTHTRTPRIPSGDMMLLGPVTQFDPHGGPWGRGTMTSVVDVSPDDWFFAGHFKNDPCMPGTLMFEGCLQLMAVYLTALGYTGSHDGWRFEPVAAMPFQLSCRGQVTPTSRQLTYQLFVEEVHDGPVPTLIADILCTVDGLKAFHARRVGLQLTPAWPLDEGSALLTHYVEPKSVAHAGDFPFDFRSLVACANGRPSEAFGPIYSRFDGPGRVARLPNPPYHFLSRVTRTAGEIGTMARGMEVDVEYDIPHDAWYFDENGCRAMPFAVLLEAALQPCGWLASYLGCALTTDTELCFRNLDGNGTLHVDLLPDAGTLLTRVKSTRISSVASMIIVGFDVVCSVGDTVVYELDTVFGFFPQSALENQVGLPTTDAQRAVLMAPSTGVVDLGGPKRPDWSASRPRLAEPMLRMIDRVSYFDPQGGPAGLGSARGEKDVDPGEWFFKAHFFQDPVQPGSLGIEAMIQLLQWTMLEKGLDDGIRQPRFETLALGQPMGWKYRGQVIPENKLISSTLEITQIQRAPDSVLCVADASLWVDGKRIYEATGLGMRIVSGGTPGPRTRLLDPATEPWIGDHRPTWTVPALPMMCMVDLLAQGACTADPLTSLHDVRVKGWLTVEAPRTLRTDRRGDHMRLVDADTDVEFATARVHTGNYKRRPAPLPTLQGDASPSPYDIGELFHGPAFQVMQSLVRTPAGASSILESQSAVPVGRLCPVLLDAATHGIPHDQLHQWFPEISADKVAYPAFIPEMNFYGPTPTGRVRCEVRPAGTMGGPDFPMFDVQLITADGVWCAFRLVEASFPKGNIGRAAPHDRRAFLRDRTHVPGLRTSVDVAGATRLTNVDVDGIDWLPGTVAAVYGTRDTAQIAQREHTGAATGVHPSLVPNGLPLRSFDLVTTQDDHGVTVTGDGRGTQDLTPVIDFWTRWFDRDPWLVEDLYYGLIDRFVGNVVLTDPDAFAAVQGRSLMYLGNHQVGVESLLFSIIASALGRVPTVTLAKAEHRHTWLGELIAHCFAYPGIEDPRVIAFFDRDDKASLPAILQALAAEMTGPGRSVMVHVEGTRSLHCTTPVEKMSGAFIDMALAVGAPVVPIRFVGGLPRDPVTTRLEFPVGMGRQDIYIGRPILPRDLAPLHYGARKQRVIAAINALGPSNAIEQPLPGDPEFAARVTAWQARNAVSHEHAVLGCVLADRPDPVPDTRALLEKTQPVSAWIEELRARIFGR